MPYKKIINFHLPEKQEIVLRKMYEDYGNNPIDMTQFELAVHYKTSADTIRRIFSFLKRYELVTQYKLGYKVLTCLDKEVESYLQNPRMWSLKNCKQIPLQTAFAVAAKIAG